MRDTLEIRFKLDSTTINLDFSGNRRRLLQFEDNWRSHISGRRTEEIRLDVYAGASPEGSAAHNRELGQGRGESIAALIQQRMGLQLTQIHIHNEGARWQALEASVAASNEVWKDTVLSIIRLPASADTRSWDHREVKLRALMWDGEAVWPVLLKQYLAPLRSGGSAVLSFIKPPAAPARRDTLVIRDTVVIIHEYPVPVVVPSCDNAAPKKERELADQSPVWSVKSNLLLLAALAPNVQVEFPLGRKNRWSIEGEFIFPWWTFGHNAYAEQLLNLGAELRLWLGKREYHPCLDGWHIGLGAGFGYYDLEWRSHGTQGEHINAYVNVGWQHRWGREKRWGVDLGIGLGAIYTPRNRYYIGSTQYPANHTETYDDHLMYQEHVNHFYPGVTHANVSLMYFFGIRDKKKEVRP